MDLGTLGTALRVVVALSFMIGGSFVAIMEYQTTQECLERHDPSNAVFLDCKDFMHAVYLYGGSLFAVIGAGVLVLGGRSQNVASKEGVLLTLRRLGK